MRVVVVITGAAGAAFAPYWANWLKLARPDVTPHYLVSHSATKFVTPLSLQLVSDAPVTLDTFEGLEDPLHVRLADWMDAMVVYPCSLSYLTRLAQGNVDVPSLLAGACSSAPVVVAPALPPGAHENEPYLSHVRALSERPEITIAPPIPVRSSASSREGRGAAPLSDCFELLGQIIAPGLAQEAST